MMSSSKNLISLCLGAFLFGVSVSCLAQANPDKIDSSLIHESVEAVLGTGSSVQWHPIFLPDSTKNTVKERLKIHSTLGDTLYIGKVTSDKKTHYILPDIAPSRSEVFSYLLYFNASKEITGVDVLEYRENYGYEIDYSYFRDQFKGIKDPEKVIFGRTIQNISGATISARSVTNSVHDLLQILKEVELP